MSSQSEVGRNHSVRCLWQNRSNRQSRHAERKQMSRKVNVAFASGNTAGNGCVDVVAVVAPAVVTRVAGVSLPPGNKRPSTKKAKGVSHPLGQQSNEANHFIPCVGDPGAWHKWVWLLSQTRRPASPHARVHTLCTRMCPSPHLRSLCFRCFLWLRHFAGHDDSAADVSSDADGGPVE